MTEDSSDKTGQLRDGERTVGDGQTPNGSDTHTDSSDTQERLAAENRTLRERVEELETTLAEVRDELTNLKSANRTDSADTEQPAADGTGESTPELVTQGGSPTKVIGRLSDDGGIGVLGEATGSGETIGVQGMVDSNTGYGLYTPDDAKILGSADVGRIKTSSEFIADIDGEENVYVTGLGSNGEAGNVFLGHTANWFSSLSVEAPVGATVAGGGKNNNNVTRPNVVYDDYGTVGGGIDNQAGDNDGDETSSRAATVPGGENNEASGSHSFAAGKEAKATTDGTFVWADSSSGTVTSGGQDQFIVEANGGTGIGTTGPVTTFHVKDSVAESGGDNLGRHVAAIENTSTSSSPVPDVLGLELTNETDPGEFNSYISFMDSAGTIGNIQGNGNGGIAVKTTDRLDLIGTVNITETGAQVYPGSTQGISDTTVTTVNFDQVVADPRNEFDTSANVFSPDIAGDYRVTVQILWSRNDGFAFSEGTEIRMTVKKNGSAFAQDYFVTGNNDLQSTSIAKTAMDLQPSDDLLVTVRHDAGAQLDIDPDSDDTYAEFIRVG